MVSVFDRSFLYGDGLFETLLVANGKPFRWTQHLERLRRGAEFLGIKLPFAPGRLRRVAGELIAKNKMPEALLRLTLSRGVGRRGYSPKGADRPTLVMSLHPAPGSWSSSFSLSPSTLKRELQPAQRTEPIVAPGAPLSPRWNLITASLRLPANEPLAQFKTSNKLPQVLARGEAEAAGADEALLLNTDGFVVEASTSNLFWMDRDTVCTPPLASGILAGVTREAVLEICKALRLKTRERNVTPGKLKRMDGVFLSLSSWGVVEARSLDGRALKQSPVVDQIRRAYQEFVRTETS